MQVMPFCYDGTNDMFEASPWDLEAYSKECQVARLGVVWQGARVVMNGCQGGHGRVPGWS